jgi:hypothetical protein
MGHHRKHKSKHKHRHEHEPEPQQAPPSNINSFGNMNLAGLFQILSAIDINQISGFLSTIKIDPTDERNVLKEGDPRIDLLNSLKPFLPNDKTNIVDEVIRVFSPKPNYNASNPVNTTTQSTQTNNTSDSVNTDAQSAPINDAPAPENTNTTD